MCTLDCSDHTVVDGDTLEVGFPLLDEVRQPSNRSIPFKKGDPPQKAIHPTGRDILSFDVLAKSSPISKHHTTICIWDDGETQGQPSTSQQGTQLTT
jgi:hypothetical protein